MVEAGRQIQQAKKYRLSFVLADTVIMKSGSKMFDSTIRLSFLMLSTSIEMTLVRASYY